MTRSLLLAQRPAHAVDMPLEISALYKLRQQKLLENGDGAGIKAELILKDG